MTGTWGPAVSPDQLFQGRGWPDWLRDPEDGAGEVKLSSVVIDFDSITG